jgi:hypothetical protein
MIDPRGRSPWVAGELPSRASPRRRQGPPSALLVERLLRANRKTLVGRPLTAALRQTAGKSGRPRPLVVLLLAVGSALLAAAAFSAAASVFAAGGVAAMVVAVALSARQRAARLATQTGYAGELTRDAALLDAYLAKVSGDLPPAALGALAAIKEKLARAIAARADTDAIDIAVEETFFIQEMVARYLPDACRHYVEAARAAGIGVLEEGCTTEQSLCRQLDILHARLQRMLAGIAARKAQALANHEAFVRSKE